MALAMLLRKSNLPALTNAASKIMASQTLKSTITISPIIAQKFTTLNRNPSSQMLVGANTQIVQNRNLNHAQVWAMEKYLSAALLGIIPFCLYNPCPINDNILAIATVVHMHWGVEAVVVDYIRPVIFGNVFPKIARMLVYALSVFTLGGLMYFNFNDIGIAKAIRRFWSIKHN